MCKHRRIIYKIDSAIHDHNCLCEEGTEEDDYLKNILFLNKKYETNTKMPAMKF